MNTTRFAYRGQAAQSPRTPRLTRREKQIIAHHALAWLGGNNWFFIGGPTDWTIDLRNGRAHINLARGCGLSDAEIRRNPGLLIERWESKP